MSKIGSYEIVRKLGAGAMGQVYLGYHPILKQHHAIKVMTGQFSRSDLKRFQRELEIVAAIKHPNVISIHSAGVQGEKYPYYVMDFVKGEDLEALVGRGPLDPEMAATMTLKLANALSAFHDLGVIHRDIKPANILIDKHGQPRLADFGLAKNSGETERLTNTGEIVGTPIYMSPEQATGQHLDSRTDIYSLGAILFELLAGRAIVLGQTTGEVLQQIANGETEKLENICPDVPGDLAKIVRKATAYRRERRYASATELALDLESFLERDEPALNIGQERRLKRMLLVPILLLLIIGGASLGYLFWQDRERKRVRATQLVAFAKQVRQVDAKSPEKEISRLAKLKDSYWKNADVESKGARRVFGQLEVWQLRHAIRRGDLKMAQRHLEAAKRLLPSKDPDLLGAKCGLELQGNIRSFKKTEADLMRAISKRRTDGEFHAWAARLYLDEGQLNSAESEADAARLHHFPVPNIEAELAHSRRNYEKAIRLVEEEGAQFPKAKYLETLSQATLRSLTNNRLAPVNSYLTKIRKLDSAHIFLRRVARRMIRECEDQLEEFDDFVSRSPRAEKEKIRSIGQYFVDRIKLARLAMPGVKISYRVRRSMENASFVFSKLTQQNGEGIQVFQLDLLSIIDVFLKAAPKNDFIHACYLYGMGSVKAEYYSLEELNRRKACFLGLPKISNDARASGVEGIARMLRSHKRIGECKAFLLSELSLPYAQEEKNRLGRIYYILATCYQEENDDVGLLNALDNSLAAGLHLFMVFRDRCKVRLRRGQFELAYKDMDQALRDSQSTDPTRFDILISLFEQSFRAKATSMGAVLVEQVEKLGPLDLASQVRYAKGLFWIRERQMALKLLQVVHDKVKARNDLKRGRAIMENLANLIEMEGKAKSTSYQNFVTLERVADALAKEPNLGNRNRKKEGSD
jgi:eukaryotic-like serine/threonine-protein kinase